VHGLIYVFIVPPWQHYDEPNHFEYVWFIASRGVLPQPGDYDQEMRRALAVSMIENGFFKDLGFTPNLNSETEPIWIGGYSQLTNPPLYYILAALPLRLLPLESVASQLYAVRLVSLSLYLITILASWGVVVEITPPCHPLRLLAPMTIAALPGFTDLMTAGNNDVGAVALFSLALWGSLRLARRGLAPLPLLLTSLLVVLCFFVKETAYFALPVFILALLFSTVRGRLRRLAWIVLLAGLLISLGAIFDWGDAAFWYRSTSQNAQTRALNPNAVLGEHVIQVETSADVTPRWLVPLFQPVPEMTGGRFRGKGYTLGVWMWASEPIETITPVLHDGKQAYFETVSLGVEPNFYSFNVILAREAFHRVWVSLSPSQTAPDQNVTIYFDGMTLARGERPVLEAPVFDRPDGSSGVWGGAAFQNLLRNGSGERPGLRLQPWADNLGARFSPDQTRPSLILTYLLDWRGAGIFYRATADRLFRTFWGAFGWGHVPLVGSHVYKILLAFTFAGLIGAAAVLWRERSQVPQEVFLILGLALLAIWGMTFVRGAIYIALPDSYYPVARYAYVAIIPTVLLLSLGWWGILSGAGRRLRFPDWISKRVYLVFLIGLDLLAILSVLRYYRI
jgi:hypothetical protein